MKTVWLAASAAAALLVAAPTLAADAANSPETAAQDLTKAPRMGAWGFDLAGRGANVSAGQSLFGYANGAYMEKLVIPELGHLVQQASK